MGVTWKKNHKEIRLFKISSKVVCENEGHITFLNLISLTLHLYSEDYFQNLQSEELFDFEALKLSIAKYKNIIQI